MRTNACACALSSGSIGASAPVAKDLEINGDHRRQIVDGVVLVRPMRIVAIAGSEQEPRNTSAHEVPQIGRSSRRAGLDVLSCDAPCRRDDDGFERATFFAAGFSAGA